ncbi:hypothetical protein [Streptomyces atroolivaceus]|uniref:hypothetical protein n=1 Tax=Streptomyces atroolivaceus TaxID=66869 RepID=UPI003678D1BB
MAWFKSSAHDLVERVDGYLEILAAHGVDCRRLESSSPGRIIYEDPYQVVVMPEEEPDGRTAGRPDGRTC